MTIEFEKEVIAYMNVPSIPKKEWNGKDSFQDGIAILNIQNDRQAYAVCTFNKDTDKAPRIKKVFSIEPFKDIDKVFVIPSYMDNSTENADLDAESKKKAEQLAAEARELENKGTVEEAIENAENLPEWIFPEIQSLEQAQAYIREYNRINKIKKGKVPTTEESTKLRLYNIYMSNKDKVSK